MSKYLVNRFLATTALSIGLIGAASPEAFAFNLSEAVQDAVAAAQNPTPLSRIDNLVVIYLENRSFDNIFGTFPGANGIANASSTATAQLSQQNSLEGAILANAENFGLPPELQPLPTLDPVNNSNLGNGSGSGNGLDASPVIQAVDPVFKKGIPNGPWDVASMVAPGAWGGNGAYNAADDVTGDLVHRFYEEQRQINNGKMNLFVAATHAGPDAGGLVMSYYANASTLMPHLWSYAQNYALLDNFFHGAFGGSFLNHAFLVCACAFTTDSNANAASNAAVDTNGMPQLKAIGPNPQTGGTASAAASKDGAVTTDGKYWVNTSRSVYLRTAGDSANGGLVQPQTLPHIGDRLTAAGVSWKWYSHWYKRALALSNAVNADTTLSNGAYSPVTPFATATVTDPPSGNGPTSTPGTYGFAGYSDPQYSNWGTISISQFNANMGTSAPYTGANPFISRPNFGNLSKAINFQWHHNPFAYFQDLAPGTPDNAAHLQDRDDLFSDIANNTLPSVAFYKPSALNNMHPGYTNLSNADSEVFTVVEALKTTDSWKNGRMMVVVTFDENGGLWDHVAPPKRDVWGPGTRIPTLVISPQVKNAGAGGTIDHTTYDTTSILKTIETRWHVPPLNSIDANAAPLTNMLQ